MKNSRKSPDITYYQSDEEGQRPDNELIKGCRDGDEDAFTELYTRYRRQLFTYLNRLLPGQHAVVDDLFQQAWIKVLDNIGRYREQQRFISWLFRIGHNLAIDHFRRNRRFTEMDAEFEFADDRELPWQDLHREEMLAKLEAAVQELAPEQREVVLLRQQQLSFNEIAEIQHASVNTVLGRMHYAVSNLRKKLLNHDNLTKLE